MSSVRRSVLNVLYIARRELGAYFASPIAYLVIAAFLAVTGYLFALITYYSREATLRYLFHNMTTLLLFMSPLLTMRLLAEEQRSGTIELLLTSPVRDWEVVIGKFLASLGLLVVTLICTLYYPIILNIFQANPDWGPMVSGYLGILLFGGATFSIGLFTSSLSRNQIVAAILGVGILLILWLLNAASSVAGPPLSQVISFLALSEHFLDFPKGVIDSKDVIYYLSVMAVGLFLATRTLETRRWS